ncbi:MAG: hypothetical protein P8R54_00535 [Myxococcota bacterium]|nr:hypothetical protein [Myxococcota bacterium]
MIAFLLALGCAAPPPPTVVQTEEGISVSSEAEIVRVEVVDPAGIPLIRQRPAVPMTNLGLQVPLSQAGDYSVRVQTTADAHDLTLPVAAVLPMVVSIEAPVGQGKQSVSDGDTVSLALIDGQAAQVGVTLTARTSGEAVVTIGALTEQRSLRSGERLVVVAAVDGPVSVSAALSDAQLAAEVVPEHLTLAAAQEALSVAEIRFPADPGGILDPTRPAGRITLPSGWWSGVLKTFGLGFRPQASDGPWAWQGVALDNHSERAINVVVRSRILDTDGTPAPAFRPRMRDGDDGSGAVSVLLRVPPGQQAVAGMPVYVDESLLGTQITAEQSWRRVVEVIPLGASAPLLTDTAPLYVSRGSTAASAGLLAAITASFCGGILLLRRGRGWLTEARTSELMTIALFAAMGFLVSVAGRLIGVGVAAALGPFSVMLTGLIDDMLRYALLATLLTLLPRPGTATLVALTQWLLSGIALGSFGPTDLLFITGRVFWLESGLWLTGITRSRAWLDERPFTRWLRLAAALSGASAAANATGLILHVTLYRLFLADWYVAMVILGPGFLYVAIAVAVAVPFADSLRRIQR